MGVNRLLIVTNSASSSSSSIWNYGRMILQNIQTRVTVEKEMKRPDRKLMYFTETPKSTGQR